MLIPRATRASSQAGLFGMIGLIVAVVGACQSPESFHKKADGGLVAGSGGATFGPGDATVGSGGAPTGGGGDSTGSGGAEFASGGSPATGGSGTAAGGAPGQGGAVSSGGSSATGGATASGGAGGAASGGAASGGAGVGGTGSGSGGAVGEGGSTSMTCSTCTLTVTYLPIGTTDGKSIAAEVHIATTAVVPINRISVRYWYTNETGSPDITTDIDYVGLSTGTALSTPTGTPTTAVMPARTNANTVTTISVSDTMLLRPGTQLFIKFRIHQANYSGTFMLANDYSFGATQTLATPWPKITAYVSGVRAWGTEPP